MDRIIIGNAYIEGDTNIGNATTAFSNCTTTDINYAHIESKTNIIFGFGNDVDGDKNVNVGNNNKIEGNNNFVFGNNLVVKGDNRVVVEGIDVEALKERIEKLENLLHYMPPGYVGPGYAEAEHSFTTTTKYTCVRRNL